MHPFRGSVRPLFFFPDGDDLLEAVDGVAARLEGLVAMRATDGDSDANLADCQMTHAMDHGEVAYGPACTCVGLDFRQLLLGHAGVRLVIEGSRDASVSKVAYGAEEGYNRAAV